MAFNRESFKLGLKHWTGTVIIGVIAALVIWGLLYGQEFLANFLFNREVKIEIETETETNSINKISSHSLSALLVTFSPTPVPRPARSPSPAFTQPISVPTLTPNKTPTPTPIPSRTPVIISTSTPSPTPSLTPSQNQNESEPEPEPQQFQCESGEVDINTAAKTGKPEDGIKGLTDIIHIGPARADQIISLRQEEKFNSVDDLIRVSGIGPSRLDDIKEEGIACVQ